MLGSRGLDQGELFFFFFLISKSRIYIEKTSTRLPKSTQEGYKRGEHHHSHLYPNQVKKSTKELKLSPLNILAQDHKVNKKEDFILEAEGISLSKATLFLSIHTVQNKHRGALAPTKVSFLEGRKGTLST